MDLATIIGMGAVFVTVIAGIMYAGDIIAFWDVPSMFITIGGTLAATVMNYPMTKIKDVAKITANAFRSKDQDPSQLIQALVNYAVRARREGLLALESEAAAADDQFLRKGLGLVVDGTDPEMVRSILETDLAFIEERHKQGAAIFETAGMFAPAFGLIGTLIGLILMLKKLDDPTSIGPSMAVALLTTFYGSCLANMVLLPLAGKLKVKSAEEILRKEVMIEGILAIQAGEGPSVITEKLNSFLSPAMRGKQKGGGRGEEV